ncbi:MAG: hypothetical protein AAGD13_17140 [Pseudomonadota bacterium]
MSEARPSLTLKVENFVSGVIRFLRRYLGTVLRLTMQPKSFNARLARDRKRRVIVPPLTFLILGCFFFSVIVDTFADGWVVYFNWIWLDQEIGQQINDRGVDLFSLTAIVRSGLPTFLCFAILAQILAWCVTKSGFKRPNTAASITYAFGLHTTAFAFACFLPIIGVYALNPESSGSVVSNLWEYGLAYLVLGATVVFAVVAFLSPVLVLVWAAKAPEARRLWKPLWVRSIMALPVFLTAIFLSTELGSIPGRFSEALQPDPNVEYQVMQDGEFQGSGPGDVSRYVTAFFFDNKTDELAYIDASAHLVSISIFRPDGTEVTYRAQPRTLIRDEQGILQEFLPIQPGKAELVHFEVVWQLDAPLGDPTEINFDGSWSYDGFTAKIVLDPMSGADLESEIIYEPNFLSVAPWQ